MDIKDMMQILKENYKREDLKFQFAQTQENVLKFYQSHHDYNMVRLINADLNLSTHVIDMIYDGTMDKVIEYLSDLDTYPREQLYEFLEQKAKINL